MHRTRTSTAACIVIGLSILIVATSGRADPEPRNVAQRVHADGHYPSRLPMAETTLEPATDPGLADEPYRPPAGADRSTHDPSSSSAGSWGIIVAGVLVAALIIALILVLTRDRPPTRAPRSRTEHPVPIVQSMPVAKPRSPDALASLIASGRLDEALALLFAMACGQLGRFATEDPSDTAREILAAIARDDPRHAAFKVVVDRVEAVRFAGRRATHDDIHTVQDAVSRLRSIGASP